MKKILLLIIGVIIGCMMGVKASELILSRQIIYKDNKTVEGALDELYDELSTGKQKFVKILNDNGIEATKEDSFEQLSSDIETLISNASSNIEIIECFKTSDDGNNHYMYYDVSSYSGYENFTEDNFFPVITSISYAGLDTITHNFVPEKSYDSSTGILTYKYRYVVRGSYSGAVIANMHLIY